MQALHSVKSAFFMELKQIANVCMIRLETDFFSRLQLFTFAALITFYVYVLSTLHVVSKPISNHYASF